PHDRDLVPRGHCAVQHRGQVASERCGVLDGARIPGRLLLVQQAVRDALRRGSELSFGLGCDAVPAGTARISLWSRRRPTNGGSNAGLQGGARVATEPGVQADAQDLRERGIGFVAATTLRVRLGQIRRAAGATEREWWSAKMIRAA